MRQGVKKKNSKKEGERKKEREKERESEREKETETNNREVVSSTGSIRTAAIIDASDQS